MLHNQIHPEMIIGGQPASAKSGARYSVSNPANRLCVGTAPLGDAEDAHDAVESAANALPAWRARSVADRATLISLGLKKVTEHIEELASLLTREQGKPLVESLAEISDFVAKMEAFIRLGCSSTDGRIRLLPSMSKRNYGELGQPSQGITVGLIAWNFPIGLIGKKAGPALMSGGTAIIKPAYTTPLSTLRLVGLMNEAGLPPGVLNCVTGRGEVVGAALVSATAVERVHLTGSDDTGKRISEQERSPTTDLWLDLAGSDPMIVCHDADLSKALEAALVGRYRNAGQVCTAVKRLYVAAKIYDDFVQQLSERVRLLAPGDGMTKAVMPAKRIGPLHTAAHRDRLEAQVADALREGARLLVGGYRPEVNGCDGYFFAPSIITDMPPTCKLVTEEVFGPVLPVFKTNSFAEAIEQANQSAWDLSASVWTNDSARVRTARRRVRCRQLWVNRLSFGVERAAASV